jgi:hypothetical protein
MSFTATHHSKVSRRACQACRARKARFQYRGRVRADRDHVLCFECYRAERQRDRARRLAEVPGAQRVPLMRDLRDTALSDRQVAHRQRMLRHLATASAGGQA